MLSVCASEKAGDWLPKGDFDRHLAGFEQTGWMDGWTLFLFLLSFIHTHHPSINKASREVQAFQTLLCLFSFSLSLSRVCFVIDRSRGGTGNVGDLSNLPAGMLLLATRVCVCESGPEMRKSVCVCVYFFPFYFFGIISVFLFVLFLFFFFLCALTCFM